MQIILASSSIYRKKLLSHIISNVSCISPNIDEQILGDESPCDYVCRLAFEKAKSVPKKDALVIGSDQCGELNGVIINKPKDHKGAVNQLMSASGNVVVFYTGLCLYNSVNNTQQIACERFEVKFRTLSKEQIEAYLKKEQPYDCAGSFKSEGLGIALFEKIQGDDPNTLIGLPMITLVKMLYKEGIDVLTKN